MEKQEKTIKKLVLNKETLRILSEDDLSRVVGGMRKVASDATDCNISSCWGCPTSCS